LIRGITIALDILGREAIDRIERERERKRERKHKSNKTKRLKTQAGETSHSNIEIFVSLLGLKVIREEPRYSVALYITLTFS